jgi:ribosome biogenesis GTPase A
VKGNIVVVVMQRDEEDNLICYNVPESLRKNMPQHIRYILEDQKYLGVPSEANEGKRKTINKLHQKRIAIISKNTHSIQEAVILHNMIVCQVATFSPICISMMMKE